MDRTRPGDISPATTSIDEYRAAHDVSPLSPITEDGRALPRRGSSRRWRGLPNDHRTVSPASTIHEHQTWISEPDASSSLYSHDSVSPPVRQAVTTDEDVGHVPPLILRKPVPTVPTAKLEENHQPVGELVTIVEDRQRYSIPDPKAPDPEKVSTPPRILNYWAPIWLRDYFIISLAFGFAAVAVAIFALYLVSSRNSELGFYEDPSDLVYLWRYMPVAVVVFLSTLWDRVDFTARLLQPWANLRSGPASAERSIFLDLISPILPIALANAVRTGSFVPILTMAGAVLLNIAKIFSTGLIQEMRVSATDRRPVWIKLGTSSSQGLFRIIENYMLTARQVTATNTATSQQDGVQDRVQVTVGASAPVITLLLLCLGISIAVLFKKPQDVVPRDPRSIGGLALLLRCNSELSHYFRSDLQHLKYHLHHERFFTLLPKTSKFQFAITREAMNPTFQPPQRSVGEKAEQAWWWPAMLATWCRILALVLPLVLIGSLEGIQQVSDRKNGIATVITANAVHYGATFIPAMIMWTVGALYSSINFNTILLAPYRALSKESRLEDSLFDHKMGQFALVQLFSALRQHHLAASLTALAAVVAPWLTIVVSGLYSTTTLDTNTGDSQIRLVQNKGPKIALQVLLGIMAVCLMSSWLCLRTHELLPHNPCSIAGVAALIAGGELWKGMEEERRGLLVPDGAEWMSDAELKQHGAWKDAVFGLGWWPDGRYGIDAGGRIDGG